MSSQHAIMQESEAKALTGFDEVSEANVLDSLSVAWLPGISDDTAFQACIRPFVEALGWTGAERNLIEASPHLEPVISLEQFRAVLMRLGYETRIHDMPIASIEQDELPIVAVLSPDRPVVLIEETSEGKLLAFDGAAQDFVEVPRTKIPVRCCFARLKDVSRPDNGKSAWFSDALHHMRRPIVALFILTFAANILALATPIYVMQVYNLVINARALDTLAYLGGGMLLILGLELYLRAARGSLIAYIGTRVSTTLMSNGFERVLGLPIRMVETAPVNVQVMRLKQFEGIYGFFSGSMATAALDLPFTLMFFAAIALLSPVLAIVPIGLMLVFTILGVISLPIARRNNQTSSSTHSDRQSFLIDAITNRGSVAQLRAEQIWRKRFIAQSRPHVMARFRMQFFETMLSNVAQMLVMVAGVATLLIGAQLVMAGELSVGGLIAVMMLVWRVLSPVQTIFLSLNRINQLSDSIRQVNQLMRIPLERPQSTTRSVFRPLQGEIVFDAIAFRYGPHDAPVFRNLTFQIRPGELVGISSATASGRSTLLKLILGLYKPQSGTILLDGLNLAQHDPHELRASIGNTPLEPVFFYGTVAQNMRLAAPLASDEQIIAALADAGLPVDSEIFPQGIETRLTDQVLSRMPIGTQQCLSLARMYCKNARINLLNDPAAHLDENGDRALLRKLDAIRGGSTVVIVTNKPQHLEICDRVFVLKNGAIAEDRPGALAG